MTVNAIGTFNVIRLAAAEMMKRRWKAPNRGVIICRVGCRVRWTIGQVAYTGVP